MKLLSPITTRLVLAAAVVLAVGHPARPATDVDSPPTLHGCLSKNPRLALSAPEIPIQQEDGWVGIKTNEGILFVWNVRGLYFTLSLKGKDIKPLNDPEHIFFSVDGMVFQVQLAEIRDFAPDAKEKKLNDKSILAAHRDWEAKFLEELLKRKLQVQNFNVRLSSGTDASLWQFDMPEGMNAEAKKQVYLTVVSKDYVMLLNNVVTATTSDDVARKFLLETIATLKISPTPIDVKKLSESIRQGVAP